MYSNEEIFNYKQLIKKIIEKHPTSYFAILNQKNNKEILNFIINMTPLLTDSCYKLSTKLYWVLNDLTDFPQCPICGKKYGMNKNVNLTRGYSYTCGTTCGTLSSRQKCKRTCLQRYGVDNPAKLDLFNQKRQQTCLQRYGVKNPNQNTNKQFNEKFKRTCLQKYGVDHPNKSNVVLQKRKRTCLQKYGVDNTSKLKENRQKFKRTCLQKYGVDNPNKIDSVRQKIKKTCLQKYGVQVSTKSETAKQQLKQTCLQKYGVASPILYEQFKKKMQRTKALKKYKKIQQNAKIVPMFDFDEFFKNKNNYYFKYKWKCLKCGNIFQDFINKNRMPIFGSFARCFICNPILQLTSKGEIELGDFIKFNYIITICECQCNLTLK